MRTKYVIILVVVVTALLLGASQAQTLVTNVQLRLLDRSWKSLQLTGYVANDDLQDAVPDGWLARTWGDARAIIRQDAASRTGEYAVLVDHTNEQGVAAVSQELAVPDGAELLRFWIFAKGDGGAAQVRLYSGKYRDWTNGGWRKVPTSDEWRRFQVEAEISADIEKVELLLRSDGSTLFDDAYVWFVIPDAEVVNSLVNPEFEQDGLEQPPLEWWQAHVSMPEVSAMGLDRPSDRLTFTNIIDMLSQRYTAILARAGEIGDGCTTTPGMTSWLLDLGPEFEQVGGKSAREKLYQISAELAPSCAYPHNALAELYESRKAFWAAAEQYNLAAQLSGTDQLAGYYAFKEGLLHVRQTGDMERAIAALEKAEQLDGWVSGTYFQGAATYNLGLALQSAGRLPEATAAFERVIACTSCRFYRDSAIDKVDALHNQ